MTNTELKTILYQTLRMFKVEEHHLDDYSMHQLRVLANVAGIENALTLSREKLLRALMLFKSYYPIELIDAESVLSSESKLVLTVFVQQQYKRALDEGVFGGPIESLLADSEPSYVDKDNERKRMEEDREEVVGYLYYDRKYAVLVIEGDEMFPAIEDSLINGLGLRDGDLVKAIVTPSHMRMNRKLVMSVLAINGRSLPDEDRKVFSEIELKKPKCNVLFGEQFGETCDIIANFKLGQSIVFGLPNGAQKAKVLEKINDAFEGEDLNIINCSFEGCDENDSNALNKHFVRLAINVSRSKRAFECDENVLLVVEDGYLAALSSNFRASDEEDRRRFCLGIAQYAINYINEIVALARQGGNGSITVVFLTPTTDETHMKDAVYFYLSNNCTSAIALNEDLSVDIERSASKTLTRVREDKLRKLKKESKIK